MEDILEPLESYKTYFKETHARNTSEYFDELVRRSGVNEQDNIKTVKRLRELEHKVANESSTLKWWKILRVATVVSFVICLFYVLANFSWPYLILPVAVFAPVIFKLSKKINENNERLKLLESECELVRQDAWQQMAPLNQLYDWDIMQKLVQKTTPRIELDPYFSNGRLDEMRNSFGWDGKTDEDESVIFTHSGVLNGNPFILSRNQQHWMGTKTYNGSLAISWTESVRDSNGKWTTVTRHQTLHASVEKPFPEYGKRTFIILCNEAAPDLSFSRTPSDLSKLKDGVFNNWKKKRAIKNLESKARDLKNGNGFTVMSNQEFDALFNATNRNHEVQFRLLFTPLAQQEMTKLLKDSEVGYGDDFEFEKHKMVNLVEPEHMRETDISSNPEKFYAYELAHARKFFNEYQNDLFKSFFFGIAPLLSIPLYQQHRSHADIYKDVYTRRSSFWEHESIANYFGEDTFRHPKCVTRSILKTMSKEDDDGTQTVHVTAHGYSGTDRFALVPVHGGDGKTHNVRVDWVEYNNVKHTSKIVVFEKSPLSNEDTASSSDTENDTWMKALEKNGIDQKARTIHRRSIFSAVIPT